MMCGARCKEAALRVCLRLRPGLGVSVLDISVGICVRGWIRLGGHDPGEGREGWVDKEGQMGMTVVAVACSIAHVKDTKKVWK